MRAGTENVAAIVGFGAAVRAVSPAHPVKTLGTSSLTRWRAKDSLSRAR